MSSILNTQTFVNLPTCSAVPSSGSQLINKTYGDGTYGILTAANTWSGSASTFNANPIYPTGATVGYVPTCTNVSGTWTWQQIVTFITASVTTSSTSPTTLVSVAVPSNSSITIAGNVVARNATFTDSTGGGFNVTAVNNAGTVTLTGGNPFITVNAQSTGTFNATVSGTNLIIQVTAPSSASYLWQAQYSTNSL